jgi:tRNA pseudouridine38-40 synthase
MADTPCVGGPSSPSPRRWRIDLSYDGRAYRGFARQPGLPTVQSELERALSVALSGSVRVSAAGRTDAGVHALGQVIAFDEPDGGRRVEPRRLTASLAALLPDDIRALSVAQASPGFDPRRDALAREYLYLIALAPSALLGHLMWERRGPVDAAAMAQAAAHLVGTHDFTSFALSGTPQPRVRDLMRLDLVECRLLGCPVLVIRALGSGFLHGMVRAIAGTLVEVGRGRSAPSDIPAMLAARDRPAAGPAAPAAGLVLARVIYDPATLDEARSQAPSSQLTRYISVLDSEVRGRL